MTLFKQKSLTLLAFGCALASTKGFADESSELASRTQTLAQVSKALLGSESPPLVQYFYSGKSPGGIACVASVDTSVKNNLTLSSARATRTGSVSDASETSWILALNAKNTISATVRSNGNTLKSDLVKHYKHDIFNREESFTAELKAATLGADALESLEITEDNVQAKSTHTRCDQLQLELALKSSQSERLAWLAMMDYAKNDEKIAKEIYANLQDSTCALVAEGVLACDFTLKTDYTPDTLHAHFKIENQKVISVIDSDYEPGC